MNHDTCKTSECDERIRQTILYVLFARTFFGQMYRQMQWRWRQSKQRDNISNIIINKRWRTFICLESRCTTCSLALGSRSSNLDRVEAPSSLKELMPFMYSSIKPKDVQTLFAPVSRLRLTLIDTPGVLSGEKQRIKRQQGGGRIYIRNISK